MRLRRKNKGSLLAEFTTNIYLVFVFLVFPLLDLSIVGFRTFFLWFAANQAVSAACKAKTYLQPIEAPAGTIGVTEKGKDKVFYPSACEAAATRARQIKEMLSGIHWEESDNNPDVQIVRQPINPNSRNALPAKIFSRGHGAPLERADAPDPTTNIYTCQVVIKGQIDPLITIPGFKIPGVSSPIDMQVTSQAKYENVPGLTM